MNSDKEKTFHLGLCLAGAVSAGAYTAGVMDYLFEALDEWEKRRDQNGVPKHRIKISAIGGASAGGMTAMIAASVLNNPVIPVKEADKKLYKNRPENKFYHSWVDLIQDEMFPLMLNNSDIRNKSIHSLLNSDFIEKVADKSMRADPDNWIERNYIDQHLKIFLTLSNLKGFGYNLLFRSDVPEVDRYLMRRHADYACFILNKKENEYSNDGWIPLHFRDNVNVEIAKAAAMATGAFPVGLKSRKVSRIQKYLLDNPWTNPIKEQPSCDNDPYETDYVDGGLINNEPFEKVRELLNARTLDTETSCQNYSTFKGTVLMVDPFPSEPEEFKSVENLPSIIGATFNAMINHLRTKPEHIIQAMSSDLAGQYLIAPRRTFPYLGSYTEVVQGSKAIACGSFAGFGGFINKEFRIHDFFLGRANCERFLRHHFTVREDANNPIFEYGYEGIDKSKFYSKTDKEKSLQIIPIFTEEQDKTYMPEFSSGTDWPKLKMEELIKYKPLIKSRVNSLIMNSAKLGYLDNFLLWTGSKVFLTPKISGIVLNKIQESLKEHKLVK